MRRMLSIGTLVCSSCLLPVGVASASWMSAAAKRAERSVRVEAGRTIPSAVRTAEEILRVGPGPHMGRRAQAFESGVRVELQRGWPFITRGQGTDRR
jgi:hypothetical protein